MDNVITMRFRPYGGIRFGKRGVRPYGGVGCSTLLVLIAGVSVSAIALVATLIR